MKQKIVVISLNLIQRFSMIRLILTTKRLLLFNQKVKPYYQKNTSKLPKKRFPY